MAQIKGLTIKNITRFKDHGGELLQQGSIYLNGKKVGFYSDGDWGGPSSIDIDTADATKEIEDICKVYYADRPIERWSETREPDLEEFFHKLISLLDFEKHYKKNLKKGFQILAVYSKGGQDIMVHGKHLEGIDEWLKDKKVENYKIYQSLEDFNIK